MAAATPDKTILHENVIHADMIWTDSGTKTVTVHTYWDEELCRWLHKMSYADKEPYYLASETFELDDLKEIVNWMHMMHSCGIPITPAEDSIKA
jgi:hypothetical protein